MTLPAGARLGPFEIRAQIGEGGMGEVYRAQDSRLGREVALKVLPAELLSDKARLLRFEAEARSASGLNHPNIVTIYEVGQSDELPYIAMELVEGSTLRALLKSGAPPLKKGLQILAQMADGLAKAHAAGIVHRDLKPENIMVTRDGYVKILDFGLAKLVGAPGTGNTDGVSVLQRSLTATGLVVGTAEYMSPEQACGGDVDFRSDQFALGLIAYEIVTGRRAFVRGSVVQTLTAIIQDEPEPILKVNPRVPEPLCWVVERCLAKEPEERYAATHDLARDLRSLRERLGGGSEPAETRTHVSLAGASAYTRLVGVGRAPAASRTLGERILSIGVPTLLGLALFGAGFGLGHWLRGVQMDAPAPQWAGEVLLGGSTRVFAPLVSPDGQTLAFLTLVNGVAQVAVMKPGSGDWVVLTKERSRGSVSRMDWSRDGAKIYFDRVTDIPNGVYSIPVLGGEERLVLEDAQGPEALADGSLLVVRVDANRSFQLFRYWQDGTKLQAVGPPIARESGVGLPVRAFPDGREAIFFGRLADAKGTQSFRSTYLLDLGTGSVRRFAPELVLNPPFTLTNDGRGVVADIVAGDDHRLVEVSRAGDAVRPLMTLHARPWYVSAGADGSLYVALNQNTQELLRFPPAGGIPERLAAASQNLFMHPLQLADGRVLLPSFISGRKRLLIASPGEALRPFLDTPEQSAPPVTLVGGRMLVFLGGGTRNQLPLLELASVAEGRVTRRFEDTKGVAPLAMAASRDGRSVYFVESGSLSVLDLESGKPRRLRAGNGVAVDPRNGDLIVQLNDKDGVHLTRVPSAGGPDQLIAIGGELRILPGPMGGNAVGADGRIVVTVSSKDNWFAGPALLDPAAGTLERVPVRFEGDIQPTGWGDGGVLLGMGTALKTELWRFRPSPSPN